MIQPIVEGQGEEAALPVLLRRLLAELGCYTTVCGSPVRSHRTQIIREADFKRAIMIASLKPGAHAILVLFDADLDCARTHIPNMLRWAKEVIPNKPCGVVMARREFESWFLASIESLRGERNIRQDAEYIGDPESERSAKAEVGKFMQNTSYSPPADQPALSARFDMAMAYRRTTSFRKLVNELCRILVELGDTPTVHSEWSLENL